MKAEQQQLHELTAAEIGRLTAAYRQKRHAATAALAEIFATKKDRAADIEPPLDANDAAARQRALELLNGHAPHSMRQPLPVDREKHLRIEVGALDLVLSALGQKETLALASESAAWVVQHGDEWADLCRAIIITATRLQALEASAVRARQHLRGVIPNTLPLGAFIGNGRSVVGAAWGADPLNRLRSAAIEAGIITPETLMEASHV